MEIPVFWRMGVIIHHNGAFNIFSTVSETPYWKSGLTESQLRNLIGSEADNMESRIRRARESGTSIDDDLEGVLVVNRSGPDESQMSYDDFISKFLVLKNQLME